MLVAIFADLAAVARTTKNLGLLQIGEKISLAGPTFISREAAGQRIAAAGDFEHLSSLVITEDFRRNADLAQVVDALGFTRLLPPPDETGKQHAGEDANDGDDYQKLDEGESP